MYRVLLMGTLVMASLPASAQLCFSRIDNCGQTQATVFQRSTSNKLLRSVLPAQLPPPPEAVRPLLPSISARLFFELSPTSARIPELFSPPLGAVAAPAANPVSLPPMQLGVPGNTGIPVGGASGSFGIAGPSFSTGH